MRRRWRGCVVGCALFVPVSSDRQMVGWSGWGGVEDLGRKCEMFGRAWMVSESLKDWENCGLCVQMNCVCVDLDSYSKPSP